MATPKQSKPAQKQARKGPKPTPKSKKPQASAARPRAAPIAQGYRNIRVSFDVAPGPQPGSIRVRGTEYVGRVTSSEAENILLLALPLNPSCFPGRLAEYAKLFDKFIFDDLTIHYQAACPTTTPGSLALVFDGDATDTAPASAAEILALAGCQTSLWQSASFKVPALDKSRQYFMGLSGDDDSSVRQMCQGKLSAVQFLPVPGGTSSPVGDVFISYTCTVYEPVLHPGTVPGATGPITGDGTNYTIPAAETDGAHTKYRPFDNDDYWNAIGTKIANAANGLLTQFVDRNGKRWLRQVINARSPPGLLTNLFVTGSQGASALAKGSSKRLGAYQAEVTIQWDVDLINTQLGASPAGYPTAITSSWSYDSAATDVLPTFATYGVVEVDLLHGLNSDGTTHTFSTEAPGMHSILLAPYIDYLLDTGTLPETSIHFTDDSQRFLATGAPHMLMATAPVRNNATSKGRQ